MALGLLKINSEVKKPAMPAAHLISDGTLSGMGGRRRALITKSFLLRRPGQREGRAKAREGNLGSLYPEFSIK
jgi:hypothetical protein